MVTAEEFWNNACKNNKLKPPSEIMIEFAQLHRKAILQEIAEDYTYYLKGDEGSEILNEEKFFKKVYPLNKIK